MTNINESSQNSIVFELQANANLLYSPYPVKRIWEVNQKYFDGNQWVNLDEGENRLIIWRQDLDIIIEKLDYDCWIILQLIEKQLSLVNIINHLTQSSKQIDITTVLPKIIKKGWIANIHYNS